MAIMAADQPKFLVEDQITGKTEVVVFDPEKAKKFDTSMTAQPAEVDFETVENP